MKIELLKNFGVNVPGTVMDLPSSSADLLIQRGAAKPWTAPVMQTETRRVENVAMKRTRMERK